MKLFIRKYFYTVLLFCFLPYFSNAQNNTSSPYSYYGIGDLSNSAYGRNLSLGGAGFALHNPNYLNLKNPASLTAIDSLSILFEMGVFTKVTYNKSGDITNNNVDGNLSHLVMGHRINNRMMVAYGLMPYSEIGYSFGTLKEIEGEESAMVSFWKGSGGLTKYFGSLGVKVSRNFSLGLEFGTLYGPINQTVNTTAYAVTNNPTSLVYNTYYRALTAELGFQYYKELGDKGSSFTIGGIFKPSQLFSGVSEVNIIQTYNGVSTLVYSDEDYADRYNLPITSGVGFSYVHKDKYLYTFDVQNELWKNIGVNLKDRNLYSFGIEKLPRVSLDYLKRCSFRIGYSYDTGYIKIDNYAIDDMRISLGAGFPVKKGRSTLNFTIEAGQRGTMQLGLLRERYIKTSIAFSFHDYWFIKRKID